MNVIPLGQYLLREVPRDSEHIRQALAIQEALTSNGEYRIIGDILMDKGWIRPEVLQRCLLRQREDCLREIELFESVPASSLNGIALQSHHLVMPKDTVIFRQHDKGDCYYLIISGNVVITRASDHGETVPVAQLGPGEGFGEIALLTGGLRTATVTTLTKTVLISLPKQSFDFVLASDPAVSQAFIRVLADRLSQGNELISQVRADEQAYRQFISEQTEKQEPRLAGSSSVIRKVLAEIDNAAVHRAPVLLQGEAGTELWDVAALIHRKKFNNSDVFTIDARRIGYSGCGDEKGSTDALARELAQMSGLFGRSRDALPFAEGKRIGLIRLADGGTVVVEHVDALTVAAQDRLADFILTGKFITLGEKTEQSSNARIICTTTGDPSLLLEKGSFTGKLADLLSKHVINLTPLRKRKKDIREVADHLIRLNSRQLGRSVASMSEDAYKAIMAYDWPGNIDELNAVIRRAITLSHDESLKAEHIFISPPPVSGQVAFDLFGNQKIKGLFLNKKFPIALQIAAAPFIALIILLGLFGSQDPGSNVILVLTWGYWEPFVVIGSFFFARSWCSTCPLGPSGYFIGKSFGLAKKVPSAIRKYGIYVMAAGIVAIFWAESVFNMPSSPRATATLVLMVALFALTIGYVFERRTWCRYLCPLGGMVGFLSSCSAVELRSNYNICNTSCLKHDCHVGNEKGEGCPVFEGPFSLHSNQNCVLCGNCVKVCPNNSPVFNLRIPGQELWASLKVETSAVIIGSALIGTQIFRGLEKIGLLHSLQSAPLWWLSAASLMLGITGGVIALAAAVGKRYFPLNESADSGMSHIIYCLIPLSVAFEVNFHLARLLTIGGTLFQVLGRQLEVEGWLPSFVAAPSTIKMLQVLILLAGSAASLKISNTFSGCFSVDRAIRRPILLFAFFYLILFLAV